MPAIIVAQVNPSFVSKADVPFKNVKTSGEGTFGFEQSGKIGYLDKTGKIIIPANYDYDSISTNLKTYPAFNNGYAKVIKDKKQGLIDKSGKIIIPIIHDNITPYTKLGNMVLVTKTEGAKKFYGVLSLQNKEIIAPIYEDIRFDTNLVIVKQNGKWGLFNSTGKQLLLCEYSVLNSYSKNKVLMAEKGNQYGYIDQTGKWLFEKVKSVFTLYGCYEGMISCKVNNKYGYLDLQGNEVIITRYDNAMNFESVGLAKVGKYKPGSTYSSFYGYVDKKGNEIIPLKYETIGSFNNGLVHVKDPETNRYGFMDKSGKWVIQPVYLEATSFDDFGGAMMKMTDGKYHYIDKSGKDLGNIDDKGNSVSFGKDGFAVYEQTDLPYVLIDKTGKTLKTIDDCDGIYTFSEGIAGYKSKASGLYGFLDLNGNKILPAEFTSFTGFDEGVSKVSQTINGKTKSGYITAKNELILPIKYDTLYRFSDGWGLLKNNGKYFFVDRSGNLKDPPRNYDELFEFRSGFALGKIKGQGDNPHTYYYINTQLKEAFNISAWQAYLFWEDVAIVSKDNKIYEILNKKGEIVKRLENVQTLKFCNDGMLAVKESGKWGFMNAKGETIVKPVYDSTESYKYGFGRIKSGTKWGIVDKSGTIIFETKYDNILPGENGLFIYYDGNGWGVMDKSGKILKEPTLNTITPLEKDKALARLGKTFTIIKSPLLK